MDAVDARLTVFNVEVDSCLDVGVVVGRLPFVVVVVVVVFVDFCLGGVDARLIVFDVEVGSCLDVARVTFAVVVDCFIFDVAADSFVDVVDVSFI